MFFGRFNKNFPALSSNIPANLELCPDKVEIKCYMKEFTRE